VWDDPVSPVKDIELSPDGLRFVYDGATPPGDFGFLAIVPGFGSSGFPDYFLGLPLSICPDGCTEVPYWQPDGVHIAFTLQSSGSGAVSLPNQNVPFDPKEVVWQSIPAATIPDTTRPLCLLTAQIPGPPKQLKITVQDTGAGLSSIMPIATNATVSIPGFASGSTKPLTVTATKTDQTKTSTVALTVTDVAGNVTKCDPVWPGTRVRPTGRVHHKLGR
jgi:hypothetical protein